MDQQVNRMFNQESRCLCDTLTAIAERKANNGRTSIL